jgi:hypothetical protein
MFWSLLALLSILWTATGFLAGFLLSLAVIPLRKLLKRLPRLYRRRSRTPMAWTPPPNYFDPDAEPDDFDPSDPRDIWNQWANSWSDDEIDFLRNWLHACYQAPPHRWNSTSRDSRDQH